MTEKIFFDILKEFPAGAYIQTDIVPRLNEAGVRVQNKQLNKFINPRTYKLFEVSAPWLCPVKRVSGVRGFAIHRQCITPQAALILQTAIPSIVLEEALCENRNIPYLVSGVFGWRFRNMTAQKEDLEKVFPAIDPEDSAWVLALATEHLHRALRKQRGDESALMDMITDFEYGNFDKYQWWRSVGFTGPVLEEKKRDNPGKSDIRTHSSRSPSSPARSIPFPLYFSNDVDLQRSVSDQLNVYYSGDRYQIHKYYGTLEKLAFEIYGELQEMVDLASVQHVLMECGLDKDAATRRLSPDSSLVQRYTEEVSTLTQNFPRLSRSLRYKFWFQCQGDESLMNQVRG